MRSDLVKCELMVLWCSCVFSQTRENGEYWIFLSCQVQSLTCLEQVCSLMMVMRYLCCHICSQDDLLAFHFDIKGKTCVTSFTHNLRTYCFYKYSACKTIVGGGSWTETSPSCSSQSLMPEDLLVQSLLCVWAGCAGLVPAWELLVPSTNALCTLASSSVGRAGPGIFYELY